MMMISLEALLKHFAAKATSQFTVHSYWRTCYKKSRSNNQITAIAMIDPRTSVIKLHQACRPTKR